VTNKSGPHLKKVWKTLFYRFGVNILPTSSEKNIRPRSFTLHRKVIHTSTFTETSNSVWVKTIANIFLSCAQPGLHFVCHLAQNKDQSPPSVASISRQMGRGPLFPGLPLTNNHDSAVVMCLYLATRQTRGQAKRPRFSALRSFKACDLCT
jgi:hypothetical protein